MNRSIPSLWNKSFKSQLIYGFGVILTVLVVSFSYINISFQKEFFQQSGMKQILNRSLSLAQTSKVWLMANDYVGLEAVMNDVSIYDDLVFATIINPDGKIIAHTKNSFVGKYIADEKRIEYLKEHSYNINEEESVYVLLQNNKYIDIIRSVHEGEKNIGFVNIRLDQSIREEAIHNKIMEGIIFTLISIIIGISFAYFVAKGLTNSLSHLMLSVRKYSEGNRGEVANENTVKEIAKLASEFNSLTHNLNASEELNQKLTERLELAFIATQDGLWDWDILNDTIYYSPIWKSMIGYFDDELPNEISTWEERVHPDDIETASRAIDDHVAGKTQEYTNIHRLRHKDGTWVWTLDRGKVLFDDNGVAIRMVGTHADITQEKSQREEHQHILEYQANHDALTKLPNRLLFHDRLMQGIEKAKRYEKQLAVFFIDLDRFKQINDSLGHDIGDKVLQEVADRLMEVTRKGDTLARLGGDEFTILMEDLKKAQDASILAEKILQSLIEPIRVRDHILYISSSIGISLYPQDADDAISLLKYADAAMYKAKDEGRDTFQFYSKEMTQIASEKLILEASLRKALQKEEFEVYYQPQVDGITNMITGMEALVRWNHPKNGLILPNNFIPLAEETGIIIALDQWVMKTAIKQFIQWYKEGLNPGRLALNLAMKQLQNKKCVQTIKDLLNDTGCKPEWIAFEVTEGQIMMNPDKAIVILKEISQMGIELAVDDFGTGYSSLTYLKRLPIDKLKIDQSFVRDLPFDEEDIGISKAVIALSKSLSLDVIAEGVETKEQKDFLVKNGCHNIQGYFYSKPISAPQMQKLLKEKSI
ncbi:MAG: diguanylate cyclase (GGDEF)-like protein/PAS domain S-box-containing protein [Sulfurimonas sp.]|jgi:diguanylate cyclase (GGDEF)-like protein/PAS domain S-box-containing protein|uniref:EAL domain-containing protein n=1 Tax=Sulfurimonas sp. TaxID=2022749 RepID=UPI0039E2AB37